MGNFFYFEMNNNDIANNYKPQSHHKIALKP